mmetsp:Transcript_4372/g.9616  ORF Transcript_4372/g.9616 Transcript_4372/m.9616 type:complete len:246 (-) Transcript_4372:1001-1738(-)
MTAPGVHKNSPRKQASSFAIFMSFVEYHTTTDHNGIEITTCDASKVVSMECFHAWENSRRNNLVNPTKEFRRIIVSHLTGSRKRRPFNPEVEKDILKTLDRNDFVWPGGSIRKLSCRGFHERREDALVATFSRNFTPHSHRQVQPEIVPSKHTPTYNSRQTSSVEQSSIFTMNCTFPGIPEMGTEASSPQGPVNHSHQEGYVVENEISSAGEPCEMEVCDLSFLLDDNESRMQEPLQEQTMAWWW